MNQPVPNNLYPFANGLTSSSPFIEHFDTRDPTVNDTQFKVQQRWWNKTLRNEWVLTGFTSTGGIVQAVWEPISSSTTVETLTGNSGGPVGPDGTNTINVIGDMTTVNIVGIPLTNTLTVSTAGTVATSYVEDSGTATPSSGILNVKGGTGIATTGAGNTITIATSGSVAESFPTDSGTATPSASVLNILGTTTNSGGGILTTASGNSVTIAMHTPFSLSDFVFEQTTAATPRSVTVQHTDNSSTSSTAFFNALTGGTSGGDPWYQVTVGTARSYAFGIDNPTSGQPLKINTNNSGAISPSTGTNLWKMNNLGQRNLPLQPCVIANKSANTTNITGDGTVINPVIFDETLVNVSGSYNTGTGIFTAPVTGLYYVFTELTYSNVGAAHTLGTLTIVTTSLNYNGNHLNPANVMDPTGQFAFNLSAIVSLTATQTIQIASQIGNGGKTITLDGTAIVSGQMQTTFSVFLLG